jgi:hypothetical protein
MSYNGQVNFGLLGDYDALPDLDVIGAGIADGLAELVALAKEQGAGDSPPSDGAQGRRTAATKA